MSITRRLQMRIIVVGRTFGLYHRHEVDGAVAKSYREWWELDRDGSRLPPDSVEPILKPFLDRIASLQVELVELQEEGIGVPD